MSKLKNALHKIELGLVMVDQAMYVPKLTFKPNFTVTKSTVNKITEFRKSHPDITKEFVDREINAALSDMVERMAREYNGDV